MSRRMWFAGLAALLVPLVLVSAVRTAVAAPEPAPVPERWQLDVDLGPLRAALVPVEVAQPDGTTRTEPRAYLYLTYTVSNYTGEDLLFAPSFELALDNGSILSAGEDVPNAVTREILARLDNPFLNDQVNVIGMLSQGPENAREGLVIWPLTDLDVNELIIYGAGFSGETDTLELTDPATGEPVRAILRKTLVARYDAPGIIDPSRTDPFVVSGPLVWKMR
ncbi:MAG: hypothetical protein AAGG07_14535 [Planctomycetota bacterium]